MKSSGKKNLTRGNMAANLLSFSVPFLLANLLQALYSAVDLWVVGKFGGGKIGVAAVSLWNSRQMRMMRAVRRTNAIIHRIGNALCRISEATEECM